MEKLFRKGVWMFIFFFLLLSLHFEGIDSRDTYLRSSLQGPKRQLLGRTSSPPPSPVSNQPRNFHPAEPPRTVPPPPQTPLPA